MDNPPPSQEPPRPSDDTGVLPAAPGTGATDTQLFREISSLADTRSDLPLPPVRSRRGLRLLVAFIVVLIAVVAAVRMHLFALN